MLMDLAARGAEAFDVRGSAEVVSGLPRLLESLIVSVAIISNLTVRYGSKTAISGLTVEVPEGCVGLLGPNGAGKTTLLKTLMGFIRPGGGEATVLGRSVAREGLLIRQQIGLMPELDCHIPRMNAVTFVAYAGELSGMPPNQALRRAHEVLEYCGLGEARYRDIETYSTGMKQRIKLAQALVHGPKLVLLDEPTNGLDPAGRDSMLDLVRDISHAKDVNVIVSSHLLPDIEGACDSVIVLRSGEVVTQGSIESLRATEGLQFEVELRGPSPEFLAGVKDRGVTVVREWGAHSLLSLPTDTPNVAALLFETAREAGTQVRGFWPARRSLEDVFIGAIE